MAEREERPLILFIDDDIRAGELMQRFMEGGPYRCEVFQNPHFAIEYFNEHGADLIITDLRMPGMTGMEVLAEVKAQNTDIPVIIITAFSTVDNAIDAMRLGATDFIKKPYDMDELFVLIDKTLQHHHLEQENLLLKRQLKDEKNRYGMIGHSQVMHDVYAMIEKIADIRCNVIIEGESGCGKELAARAIHYQSRDAEKPFIVIDCGSLSDTLLESELFGHEKGAFTGATQSKPGMLELATGGTVFLDEICNISDAMQTKLMRVVQEQTLQRVGGIKPIHINVRFVVATNRDLEEMVARKRFRHDLYHRLNVVKIRLPALRERRDDIPELLQHFADHFARHFQRDVKGFDAASVQQLCEYDWPGNVRELRNLVERHVALADGPVLHVESLPSLRRGEVIDSDNPSLEELERRYILKLLEKFGGNREKTAVALGINKSTLWRRLQQYRAAAADESGSDKT
ncbi:sigma-54 dependent transcriptional regulator [Sulfuriflexus sp.]|uniref:sigma-54-dependent transcriptional regulator n=1 Tax=Sulfuriflexus sp. TaxID=2015443 RepID=UPI0028CE3181|nr:sigma-54 dependent transcriptional regulator [Sulfuriflexus sp.]MDT8405004.1 sigma-54 dependent transcriptional regulator [Sulfuriflexus sp.]